MEDIRHIHRWDVLAVSCIDGRFDKRIVDWVSEKTLGAFDFRTEIGASRSIIYSVDDRERFFSVVDTAIRLHSVKEIWIFDHVDCGAYGGSEEHAGETAERAFHEKRLEEAAKLINVQYPDLVVKKIYVSWDNIEEL